MFVSGIAFALLGMVIGSFLNVVADRVPEGKSIITPPSHCSVCGVRLSAGEMIPVLSYLNLRGKCRSCGAPIPLRVPLVELGNGILFGLIWLRYQGSIETFLAGAYAAFLVTIFIIDLEHHRILNVLIYPALLLALVGMPFVPGRDVKEILLGGGLGFAILFIIALVYPGGMGMGDVKLAAFIGLIVGYPAVILALFLSVVIGGIVSGGLLLAKVIGRRDPIPFGPFLAAGGILSMLYGDQILLWWAART